MEPEKIDPRPVESLPTESPDASELPYDVPDLGNAVVLDRLTDALADFLEQESEATVYKERLKGIVRQHTDSFRLPPVLKWLRSVVINYVLAWAYDKAFDIVVGFLRGLGKK